MSSYGVVGRVGVLVEPTFKGVQKKVKDSLGAPLAQEGPRQGRNLGDMIVNGTTRVFKWGGIAAGAALGTAITKGFGRLRAMEDATAKIEGLGYAAGEVDQIMTDVQGALDGTMFLYSEGADVAAGALAAGVEQGEELESYLRLTADAATQAGIDFGSMGEIMNKVEGDGRLMGDTVQQLAENGVYILPALAEEFGVTGEEMRKMVSNGEVDAATFRRIMEEQYGGSSERAAETMTGAMSLAWTAVGQLGERLIAEVYPYLRDFFKGFYDWVQEISPAVEDFGKRVGEALGSVIGWIADNPGVIKVFAAAITSLFAAMAGYTAYVKLAAAATAVWNTVQKLLNGTMMLNPVGLWVAAIAALVVGLIWAYNNVDWFRNAVQIAWDAITTAFTWAWENVIQSVINWIGEAWNWLADVFVSVWENYLSPVFEGIGTVVAWLWDNIFKPYIGYVTGLWLSLGEVFMWVWENALSHVFSWLGDAAVWLWEKALKPAFGFIQVAFEHLGEIFMWVWENVLSHVFEAIGAVAVWLWETVLEPTFSWIGEHWSTVMDIMAWAWTYVLEPVWNAIAAVAGWLWEYVLSPIFSWIGDHWDAIILGMQLAWEYILKPAWTAISTIAVWLWEKVLQPVFSFIGDHWHLIVDGMVWVWENILKPAWDAVAAIALWLWEKALEPIFRWIGDHWDEIVFGMKLAWEEYLKPAWDRMVEVGTWLWEKLRDIFSWIGDKWSDMKDRISNIYYDYIKPVFDTFGDAVETIQSTFETVVDAIETAWNKLKEITRGPVNFVIETVYNKGIVPLFNAMVGTFGLDSWKLSEADPVGGGSGGRSISSAALRGGYYTGGWTGPGAKYDPAGVVHADEFVVRKASRGTFERENPGLLDHINRTGTLAGYAGGGRVQRPVGGRVTSGFGASRGRYPHAGIDFAVPIGTPVGAALAGSVAKTGTNIVTGRTGKGVLLSHPGNRNTYYGHLSAFRVGVGDQVSQGQTIALSGNTGRSTGPHLHFETWTGGTPVDPAKYLGNALPASSSGGMFGFDPSQKVRDFLSGIVGKVTSRFDGKFPESIGTGLAGYFGDAVDKAVELGQTALQFMPGAGGAVARSSAAAKKAQDQVKGVADGYGWASGSQWSALQQLVQKESGWNPGAANPTSTARGLFQKMTSLHGPLESSIGGQANWGLNYIRQKYGTPSRALAFHKRHNWYADGGLVTKPDHHLFRDQGGNLPPGLSMVLNKTGRDEAILNDRQWQDIHALAARGSGGSGLNVYGDIHTTDIDEMSRKLHEDSRRARAVGLEALL